VEAKLPGGEDVEPAEQQSRLLDERATARGRRDVAREADRVAADLGQCGVHPLLRAATDRDAHPFGGQCLRAPEPEPGRRGSDGRTPSGEMQVHADRP